MPLVLSGYYVILAAFICGLINWKYLSKPFRIATALCLIAFIFETLAWAISMFYQSPNHWVYNIYVLLETWMLCIIISHLLIHSGRIIFATAIALTVIWIYFIVTVGIKTLANNFVIIKGLTFITLYIVLLIHTAKTESEFLKVPATWLSIALVLFYAGTLPIMAIVNYLNRISVRDADTLYYITNVLCILRYCFLSIAFILSRKHPKNSRPYNLLGHD